MIYEATIQFVTIDNKGNDKTMKESYVIENAELFSEVENKMLEDYAGLTALDVIAIKRSSVKEIANTRQYNDDVIWEATMQSVFHDDEGNEKYTKYKVLFYSKNSASANAFIEEYMKQGYDLELIGLKLTKFIDVI